MLVQRTVWLCILTDLSCALGIGVMCVCVFFFPRYPVYSNVRFLQ